MDQAWYFLERAMARRLSRREAVEIARIGVDEKAFRKGHRVMTIVSDIDRGTVDFVTEGREKGGLSASFATQALQQIEAVEAVAMGMREPSVQAPLDAAPLLSPRSSSTVSTS
jgi:transposase